MSQTIRSGYVKTTRDGNVIVKRAILNVAAAQTDTSLVAAVSGKIIRVLSATALTGATATNLTFSSKLGADASVAISPLFANAINGGFHLPMNEHGHLQTVAGAALTVTTGAGSTTGILISYIEVTE